MRDPAIEMTIEPRRRRVGSGSVRRLLPYRRRRMVGPFIFIDMMGPEELAAGDGVAIDAHPHIGLATVTYLFEGRLVHRDSTGAVQKIDAGAVNWMTAGSGVSHTERSHPDDEAGVVGLEGLQIWVALPGPTEDGEPSFQHVPASAVPVETVEPSGASGGSVIRILAGDGWGARSPVAVSSPLVLASIELSSTSPVLLPNDHPERAVLAVDDGVAIDGRNLPAGHLVVIEPGRTPPISGTGRAVVIGGEPVGRRHIWWNFVHSDLDRIEQAKADWSAQRFPRVPGDHDPYVPLPRG